MNYYHVIKKSIQLRTCFKLFFLSCSMQGIPKITRFKFSVADPDPHHFWKLDPDLHRSEKQDPDPHQSEKVEAWIRIN